MSKREARLLAACDGSATLRELSGAFPGAAAILQEYRQPGIVILLEPLRRPPGRPRWLVLSPHQDDAALSVGGRLYALRDKVEPVILGLTTRSRSCAYDPTCVDVERVTAWRRAEDALYARFLGARLIEGGLRDASLRRGWVLRPDSMWEAPKPAIVRSMIRRAAAAAARTRPAVVFGPLGVGRHTDHLAASAALVELWRRGRRSATRYFFYEDVPYAERDYADVFRRIEELRESGLRLRPDTADIGSVLERKLEGILIYRSQSPWRFREEAARYAARCGAEKGLKGMKERAWEILA